MQALLPDQIGTDTGKVTFSLGTEGLVQEGRDCQTEDRVPEELESLVVFGREAAMGQCPSQQVWLRKLMAQSLLQRSQVTRHQASLGAASVLQQQESRTADVNLLAVRK